MHFYQTGDELFDVMCQMEKHMHVRSFFVMDENFLFHRKRALRLLELMERNGKSWSLDVFSSAKVLCSYDIEQLVRLGISWVWMGIEGENSQYAKLKGVDTFELVRELQSHGIRVLGSTIVGLENHTPENIDEALDYAARHETDFHQFMLYTPIPGTPLFADLTAKGLMKDESEYHISDIHGQLIFNYRHPNINDRQSAEYMVRAFDRDFERNGPSVVRIVRTTLTGWQRYKNHPDPCIRDRYAWEARELGTTFSALVGGGQIVLSPRSGDARQNLGACLGICMPSTAGNRGCFPLIGGLWVLRQIRKEEKRLAAVGLTSPRRSMNATPPSVDRPEAAVCHSALPHVWAGFQAGHVARYDIPSGNRRRCDGANTSHAREQRAVRTVSGFDSALTAKFCS